jgi:hypothetical protein
VSDAIDRSAARDQFRGGVIAFEQADYGAALETFLQVYEKTCMGGVLYNIGATLEQMNLPQEAADMFELFLEKHPASTREQEILQRIEMLRQSR